MAAEDPTEAVVAAAVVAAPRRFRRPGLCCLKPEGVVDPVDPEETLQAQVAAQPTMEVVMGPVTSNMPRVADLERSREVVKVDRGPPSAHRVARKVVAQEGLARSEKAESVRATLGEAAVDTSAEAEAEAHFRTTNA